MVVLTGTGRSGTTFMTKIIRDVYGVGMSAEPKGVLEICEYISGLNLDEQSDFNRSVSKCLESKVFRHLETRVGVKNINHNDFINHIETRDVNGIVTGMFKYIATLRGVDYPGYKDPLDIINMADIQGYLPNTCFIILIRKGEDVASSTLKFDWGPTNVISGVWDWRNRIEKAFKDVDLLKKESFVFLRLEDLEADFDKFCLDLDSFIKSNINRSNLEGLKKVLLEYKRPVKSYNPRLKLVAKIASPVNVRLGYSFVEDKSPWFTVVKSLPYLILDFPVRAINVLRRKHNKRKK